jgi:hypothetical protein
MEMCRGSANGRSRGMALMKCKAPTPAREKK